MNHYLLVYDKPAGKLRRLDRFTDSSAALAARFAVEHERPGLHIEAVVLGGRGLGDIIRTHSRYFGLLVR